MWALPLLIAVLLAYVIYNRFLHPLAKIPGPFLATITPLWLTWQQGIHQDRPGLNAALHKKYGSVVRIKPNEILFSNPDYFQSVHETGTKFTKGDSYQAFGPSSTDWDYLDFVLELDLNKLRVQKRYAGAVYSTKNVIQHENLIDINVQAWTERLRGISGQAVDLSHEVNLLIVDNQTRVTFGQPYGAIDKGTDDGHSRSLFKMWCWWSWIGTVPWFIWLDKKLTWKYGYTWLGFNWRYGTTAFVYSDAMKAERALSPKDQKRSPNLCEDLFTLSDEKPQFRPSWADSLCTTTIGAGVDTTTWTLVKIITAIASNSVAHKRIRDEIEEATKAGNIVPGTPVEYEVAIKLQYMQACIYEAMRLWPNLEYLVRKVPSGGITIDGYFIPMGVELSMSSRLLGRNESIFGTQPEVFRPERWLEADKRQRHLMETKNLSFGGSARKCPGMHLAWVSMSKILASLFAEFDVKVLNELNGKPGPGGRAWREASALVSVMDGVEVVFSPRKTLL